MHDVHPRHDVLPGKGAAEQEVGRVGADDRDALEHPLEDPQAGAGQLVVRQRVAEQPLDQRDGEDHDADQPVDVARLAVGAEEEVPQHVRADRDHEQVRRPVVDLPDQQAAADVEGNVQRGLVGLRHRDAVELGVRAVIHHRGHRRLEEQGQVGAGEQQDHERPERDLAEHERPVVREDLAHQDPDASGAAEPVVQPAAQAVDRAGNLLHHPLLVNVTSNDATGRSDVTRGRLAARPSRALSTECQADGAARRRGRGGDGQGKHRPAGGGAGQGRTGGGAAVHHRAQP